MNWSRAVVAGLVGCAVFGSGTASGFEIGLKTGETLEVDRVVKVFPAAVQLQLGDGSLRMVHTKDLLPAAMEALARESVAAAGAEKIEKVPAEPVERSVSIDMDVVNVGSKSSTRYSYYSRWGSNIRTMTSGKVDELRLTLRNRPMLTVQVVLVIGGATEVQDVELVQSREVPVRIEVGGGSRTVTDLRWLRIYKVERQPKDTWFAQVLHDGRVVGEAGSLPGHEAGKPLIARQ